MKFDSKEFRGALSRFATGVTVVTAAPEGFSPFGVTVNSFTALSLEPPLVLWCLQKGTSLDAAWLQVTHFAVNVLAREQEDISSRFASWRGREISEMEVSFGTFGSPKLTACLASFECELESRVDAGDHTILIGRVLDLSAAESGEPLIFYNAEYRALAFE